MPTKCLIKDKSLVIYESKEQAAALKEMGYIEADIDLTKADVQQDMLDAYEEAGKDGKKDDAEYETKDMAPKRKARKKAAN